jgi:hypothetical protein
MALNQRLQSPKSETMIVTDFSGDHSVQSMEQLEQRLEVRFQSEQNLFHLTADSGDYPTLTIHVKANLAVIYYVPEDGQTGYVSLGGKMNLDPNEMTTFSIDSFDLGESIDVPNELIVPFSEALKVAKEFFHSHAQERPRSIEWTQQWE